MLYIAAVLWTRLINAVTKKGDPICLREKNFLDVHLLQRILFHGFSPHVCPTLFTDGHQGYVTRLTCLYVELVKHNTRITSAWEEGRETEFAQIIIIVLLWH